MTKHKAKSETLKVFTLEVAKRRGIRRMSQRRLAEHAGTTQATISAIELGKTNPTVGLLADIAAVFGAELEIKLKDWEPGKN
jgi:transcriptional regulator with XRE-family HTH domain